MKEIPLTQGKVALVDDEDYELVSKWKWRAQKSHLRESYYAVRLSSRRLGKRSQIGMHQIILPGEFIPDHIDGNGLNNTRNNLRPSTYSQNSINRRIQKNNRSGFRGVSWWESVRKWEARIGFHGKRIHIGYFTTPENAARAYDKIAVELFGEFARLNFPKDGERGVT